MKKYDIILIEKPCVDGLSTKELMQISLLMKQDCFYPIEIGAFAQESSAMGLITQEAAEAIEYDYYKNSSLSEFIANILDDVTKESRNNEYTFLTDDMGLDIWLGRDIFTNLITRYYETRFENGFILESKIKDISTEEAELTYKLFDENREEVTFGWSTITSVDFSLYDCDNATEYVLKYCLCSDLEYLAKLKYEEKET